MSEILSPKSDLSARRDGLSDAKRDLLARKLQRKANDLKVITGTIARRPDAASAPLSFSQQRLWFLDQFEAGSASYNCPMSVRLGGTLERAALEWSLAEIVRRHESLRTTFANVEGRPLQLIAPPAPGFALPLVDLAGLAPPEREAEARRLARAERLRPFDLSRGPLVRVTLVRLAAQDHVFFSTIHHIVSDGWSMGILVRELGALYPVARARLPSPLPDLAIQYADYAHWQRERLRGPVLAAEVEHWRQRLAGAPPVLGLPVRDRTPGLTPRGRVEPLRLPATLSAAAVALGRGAGATPFMVLLAVLDLLLSRYTGELDLVVGTSTANRNRVEARDLIGFFINILVLRCNLAEAADFRTLLGRVREVALEAYAHEDLPFEKLVEELRPERSLHHTPLFQVMFLFQNTPNLAITLPGLSLRSFDVGGTVPKFELTFELADTAQGFRGGIEYDANVFEAVTVARLARHFESLLQCAAAAPDGAPFSYPMLSAPEVAQLLLEWNDSCRARPAAVSFSSLYAAQVERAPDAVAIAGAEGALSYDMLARRAHRLAHRLAGRGVGGDRVVALLADRGPGLLTGILGIFAAGGAYLPLDILHPPRRMGQVLARSRVSLVLVAAAHRETLSSALAEMPSDERPEIIDLESPPAGAAGGDLPAAAHDASLAYVIYTSGSTGAPKGVMVEQRGMMNHLWAKVETLDLQASDTVAQTASQCFDISVWQFLAVLLVGGRVEVLADDVAHDPVRLLVEVGRLGVSILETVPSLLAILVGEIARGGRGRSGLASLRWLVPTGEALPPELCGRWFAAVPAVPLLNAYGPTECSDDIAHWVLHEAPDAGATSVPIGRPVANLRLHLLDRDLGLVPIAAGGELYAGGIGVGRGYRFDPARTAEVFRPDPFGAETGARLYRTGDLARRRADGSLEFLGRADHQVKVRGFRIELGEIEAELGRHPGVQEAVVLALGAGQQRRLVAYLVLRGGQESEMPALRAFLLDRLPDYMVPSAFVPLAAMPLTPNAKVDRRALAVRDPAVGAVEEAAAFTAARTPVEGVLAGIWGEVLGRDRVDVEASFFDLGGHSLLATQVIARVRQVFAVELPLRKLFERPTVAGLALDVEAALAAGQGLAVPPLVRVVNRGAALPLSFAQQRLWFLDQLAPGSSAYNVHLAVRLEGPLQGPVMVASLGEVVRRHESLRTTFAAIEGVPVQRVGTVQGGWGGLPVIDLAGLPPARREDAARRLATAEAGRAFHLGGEPLLRTRLVRLGEREHVVLTTVHHIVSDGWSLGLLVQEVSILYAAFAAARPSPLPELAVQYADFTLWQRRWLSGELLERHLAYWREQLGGAPALLALPTDRPRPAVQGLSGASRSVHIPATLAGRLREVGRRHDATLFMTLLAGFQVLLSRYARQDDVSIGTPIAGRSHLEIEALIGFFVNTLVLRADVAAAGGFRALLAQVRETALAAHLHQDVPFEKLVEELAPQRSLSHSPLFQVMFALQSVPRRELAAAGLRLLPFAVEGGDAKFDLTFVLHESADALGGVIEYDRELFDGATIERLIGHFLSLAEAAAADPGCLAADLPLLGSAERQALLEWNGTAAPYPRDGCLHELVEAQVGRTPEAVAVVFEGAALSYRALDERAHRLARQLQHLGVGPETPVGVYLERGLDLVVALLGILKAGGAFLPLDVSYPKARLSQMLEDGLGRVATPVLLTESRLAEGLPATTARVLCLDTPAPGDADGPAGAARAASGVTPLGLAYVLFTSGSTGRPKGVMNTHHGIVNRLLWMQETYGLTPADRVLQKTPHSFDVSVWELFWPLLVGARLVVARPDGHRDGAYLVRTIVAAEITTLHFVPAMLQVFLDEPGVERSTSLERVVASGEALPLALVQRFMARLGPAGTELHNLYGPTEAAVDVTFWRCRPDARALVPIGRPVANTEIHLLDGRLRPVPIGVAGELYIGGVQLARGYYGRADLTAERFLPDPFAVWPGARLYRTGDLARHLPGGEIDYLGRTDHQVKIRGLRIELGEIEAELGRHPGVQEATVLAVPGASGAAADLRLVAYLIPAPRRAPLWARQRLEGEGRLCVGDLHELPNGLMVAHRNRGETEFLYQEIFVAQGYLRHGIALAEGDCIFDVGANIGLFTLFAGLQLRNVTLYAFEPIPAVCDALRTNAALYSLDAHVFDCGLAAAPGSAEFTYYPHATLISGRYADAVEERAVVRSSLRRQAAAAAVSDAEVEALLGERLRSERVTCRLRTVSEIMAENGVARIDLLKIDVEKAELEVLAGIREQDWAKIRQVVVEVHDIDGRLAQVTGLLERHGFVVATDQDSTLAQTVLYNLHARRPGAASAAARPAEPRFWCSAGGLIADLREAVKRALPEHMVPSSFVVLEALPLSPNGKVDRTALAGLAAEQVMEDRVAGFVLPRGPVEELVAEIWRDLLGVGRIGAHAHFFDLGGHSLLAMRLLSRLRSALGVDLPLRTVFEKPTLAHLAVEIERTLGRGACLDEPPILPVERRSDLPLSFAQERLWFLDRLWPGSAGYNIPAAVWLTGPLQPVQLAASLAEVVCRHEVLRTTLAVVAGRAVQAIAPALCLGLPLIDLGALPTAEREAAAQRLAVEEAAKPFDLARGPLVRALLLRLGAARHLQLLTLHHVIADGWSMGVLLRELATLYGAFAAGLPSPLAALPIQYADFAVWQRQWLTGEVLEDQLGYWRERLSGAPSGLDLPLDQPRPAVPSLRGAQRVKRLSTKLGADLADLARRQGATRFMTLFAAWNALLWRHTGQFDVSIGTPIANRTRTETEGLIGFFVNTLVLRTDLAGNPAFTVLLARVREVALSAYTHQDLPFQRLVEELRPQGEAKDSPLFQAMFVHELEPEPPPSLPGLTLRSFEVEDRTARFDLTLLVRESPDGLAAVLTYAVDLFRADTMQRLLDHFAILLDGIAANPSCLVGELPLLGAAECHQLLLGWNDAAAAVPESCLHQLFAMQVARRPQAIALLMGNESLTYAELDRQAEGLACRMAALGIGPEVRVGLAVPRSPGLIIGLLAILKAGGAYVPLDPTMPRERLRFQVVDARVAVLVTSRSLVDTVGDVLRGESRETSVLFVEHEGAEPVPASGLRACSAVSPDNLAYVIYTSGSTGTPKGVLVPHRGVVNFILQVAELCSLGPLTRILQFASIGFDASVLEIFLALATGGSLCLVSDEQRRSPRRLSAWIAGQGVNTLFMTPAQLAVLPEPSLSGVRTLLVGGESCPRDLAARWTPGRRFFNCYGPTETAVMVTAELCRSAPGLPPAGEPYDPPIGRPIKNLEAYVVDEALLPVPMGAVGELALGGMGVGRGYLGRPQDTAAKFVPHPFAARPGARLYRSGDRVRHLRDGRLEFLGRRDDQIKVRGFRIELGEIEAALLRHPGVRSAVVLAPAAHAGGRKLVAYVVTGPGTAGEELGGLELRRFVGGRLPDYMVPSQIVRLEAMPMTTSGKLDRQALPDPETLRAESGRPFLAPSLPSEQLVAELWSDVLKLDRIGVEDDFFDLGGNSIQAAVLAGLLEERLGAPVPIAALFEAPTLGGLARYLEENGMMPSRADCEPGGADAGTAAQRAADGLRSAFSPLVALQAFGSRPPLFLVHPVGGNLFCYAGLVRLLGKDQPVFGLQSAGLGGGTPRQQVEEMASAYLQAMRAVQPQGPYHLAGWSVGGVVAYELAQQLRHGGEDVGLLALLDSQAPQESVEGAEATDDFDLFLLFAGDLGGLTGSSLPLPVRELATLPEEGWIVELIRLAEAAGVLTERLSHQQALRLWQVFRANIRAARAYRPRPYLGRTVLFRAGAGELGWSALAAGGLEVHRLAGDHYALLREPAVSSLARSLADLIAPLVATGLLVSSRKTHDDR